MNKKKIIIYSLILIVGITIAIGIVCVNMQNQQSINESLSDVEETSVKEEMTDNSMEVAKAEEKNIVLDLSSDLDYAIDLTDNQARANNAEYIVLATVKSIDGTTNYNEAVDEYTAIFTYGKLEITKVLQGDLNLGEVPFIRLGGDIQFSEYEKSLKDSQKSKIDLVSTLTEEEKKESYVSYSPSGDIELEEGKTYLMYLNFNSDYNKYMCSFMQYGTREVDMSTYSNDTSIMTASELNANDSILVKNNESGEWETLSSVLN